MHFLSMTHPNILFEMIDQIMLTMFYQVFDGQFLCGCINITYANMRINIEKIIAENLWQGFVLQ